jgi:hypothetical protein
MLQQNLVNSILVSSKYHLIQSVTFPGLKYDFVCLLMQLI